MAGTRIDEAAGDWTAVPPRLGEAEVAAQARRVVGEATLLAVLEAFPGPAALLNDRRQVLVANREFREAAPDFRSGQRPGDCFGCVESQRAPDGCGTAPACSTCGAWRGLSRLEHGDAGPVREECLMTRHGPFGEESLAFDARATRLPGGWTMLALRDISGEKRRRILERCFLHDALNAAGGVQGIAQLAAAGDGQMSAMLPEAAAALVDELRHQQILLAAESGELTPERTPVDLAAVCNDVVALIARQSFARGRRIVVTAMPVQVAGDRILLRRIVGNLLRNALEASPSGGVVEVSSRRQGERAILAVANAGEMPVEVQHQVFRRYFSTKGAHGRGVGTWSVKLLTEGYLGGTVSFRCAAGSTEFTVELPAL